MYTGLILNYVDKVQKRIILVRLTNGKQSVVEGKNILVFGIPVKGYTQI